LNDKGKWITASTVVAGMAGALASSAIGAAADGRVLFEAPLDDATAQAAVAELGGVTWTNRITPIRNYCGSALN
jgi:hypothetical protein